MLNSIGISPKIRAIFYATDIIQAKIKTVRQLLENTSTRNSIEIQSAVSKTKMRTEDNSSLLCVHFIKFVQRNYRKEKL
jgi:hypothetical protein